MENNQYDELLSLIKNLQERIEVLEPNLERVMKWSKIRYAYTPEERIENKKIIERATCETSRAFGAYHQSQH